MAAENSDTNSDPSDKHHTFEQLFKKPTIEAMLALSWQDFQAFVGYVFNYAGFTVEPVSTQFFPFGPGVDFNLYNGPIRGRPVARVEVRKYAPQNLLHFPDVAQFLGVLDLAQGIPGYLVTTSGFGAPAREAARQSNGRVRLVDGKTFLRYIAYVDGSRVEGQYGSVAAAPTQPITPFWLEKADAIVQATLRPPRHTRILSISNTKGGVAKTTTALNVGFALADLQQQRVLMIDLDGQGSLTNSLPPPKPEAADPHGKKAKGGKGVAQQPPEILPTDTRFITDYFLGKFTLREVIRPTRFERLWLAPAHPDLYRIQFSGADRTQAELKFVEDLRTLEMRDEHGQLLPPFDWIVVDTPAGNTYYGRATAAAADYIVIPAYAEAFANNGAKHTVELIKTMNALMRDTSEWSQRVLGCLVTRWKQGANAENAVVTLRVRLQQEGIRMFRQAIPLDDKVETAHRGAIAGAPRSIFRLTPQMGQAAQAYDKFVEEMIQHANDREAAS